jgi:hypothetical protein
MKKTMFFKGAAKAAILAVAVATPFAAQANEDKGMLDGVGVGVGYGLISGGTLELNYAINDLFQVRGSFSQGMNLEQDTTQDNIDYNAKADGGINRIAVNYHPFKGNFFLSAGYAVSNFGMKVSGTGTGDVEIGNETYTSASATVTGRADWGNGPTLSLGWGHSAAKGWGAMAEIGAVFTGAPDVKLNATGTYSGGNIQDDPNLAQALADEERKLKDDLSSADFMPILQAQVTYRF